MESLTPTCSNSADWEYSQEFRRLSTVDQASWNSSTASGVSLEEDSTNAVNDWVSAVDPAPGSANSASAGPVVYPILIMNEVMPNPWPSDDNASWPGGEWSWDILNTGTSDISLLELVDSRQLETRYRSIRV